MVLVRTEAPDEAGWAGPDDAWGTEEAAGTGDNGGREDVGRAEDTVRVEDGGRVEDATSDGACANDTAVMSNALARIWSFFFINDFLF